jgi:tRNA threonylcarbamoyladenosine biosynthesis protein TsaE
MSCEVHLQDANDTVALAAALARAMPGESAGWSVLLQGELGSGKSTLARAFLRSLGHTGPVPSPTYTLVEPYDIDGRIIYHVDLYRISDQDELRFLGWSDWQEGLLLVEWPERAESLLDPSDLRIRLEYADPGRRATLESNSTRGAEVLRRLAPAISLKK